MRPQDRRPHRQSDPPTADYRNRRIASDRLDDGSLELTTPFGFSGRLAGGHFVHTLLVLGLLLAIAVIGYLMWDANVRGFKAVERSLEAQTGVLTQFSVDLAAARRADAQEHSQMAQAYADLGYIISIPPDKRGSLRLEEPVGFRRRMRGE